MGSARWASNPAEMSSQVGSKAAAKGASTSSTPARNASPVAPAGSGRLIVGAPARAGAHLAQSPGPRVQGVLVERGVGDAARRSRRCPGCRCRGGRRSRRPAPARRASASAAAVTATLLNRQNPIDRVGVAWCPGGRTAQNALSAVPASRRVDRGQPGAGGQQGGVVGGVVHGRVGVDPAAALTADPGDHGDEAFVVHAAPAPPAWPVGARPARSPRRGRPPRCPRGPIGAGRVALGDRGRGRGRGTARGSAGARSRAPAR